MPRSPKRYGLIMDNGEMDWALPESPPSLSRSSSVYSDNTDADGSQPSTPRDSESSGLEGFHFSTTDENVDAAEFHRMAAQLLGGGGLKRKSRLLLNEQHVKDGHLHCNMGRDPTGRHCCSCGRTYSTPFRLNQHIQQCTGIRNYACPRCDQTFDERESRDRHVDSRHSKESCPGCGVLLPPGHVQKHLATGQCGGDSTAHPRPPGSSHSSSPLFTSADSMSQKYWIHESDNGWDGIKATKSANDSTKVSDTLDFVKQLLNPMVLPSTQEPCDLCGEMLNTNGDELSRHLGEHSVDFCDKRHRCGDCQIFFANERDLERHLQSANLIQHCGLTFHHADGQCSGHHPPVFAKIFTSADHHLMQKHLSAWETSQLRAHRAKISNLLASTLNTTATFSRAPSHDSNRTYSSLIRRPSTTAAESLPPISEAVEESEDPEGDDVEAEFCRILSEFFPGKDQIPTTKAPSLTHKRSDSALTTMKKALVLPHKRSESALTVLTSRTRSPTITSRPMEPPPTTRAKSPPGLHRRAQSAHRPVEADALSQKKKKSVHELVSRRSLNPKSPQNMHKKSRTMGSFSGFIMPNPNRESGALGITLPPWPSKLRESVATSSSSRPSTISESPGYLSPDRPSSVATDILLAELSEVEATHAI